MVQFTQPTFVIDPLGHKIPETMRRYVILQLCFSGHVPKVVIHTILRDTAVFLAPPSVEHVVPFTEGSGPYVVSRHTDIDKVVNKFELSNETLTGQRLWESNEADHLFRGS